MNIVVAPASAVQVVENDDESDVQENPGFQIEQDHNQIECAHCFCSPCITDESNRQLWWETTNTDPSEFNSCSRKSAYRKFWTMMLHHNVWNDPRYQDKKTKALQIRRARGRRFVTHGHQRDIMPNCVIDLVRGWYPNPENILYMGLLIGSM
jgi:hypothetical protein